MSNEYLAQKFPNMRPITSAPSLSTVNGIGMQLIGRRDFDEETKSYVATHALCILFIPLIPIGAYRVFVSERFVSRSRRRIDTRDNQ
jgi:hypothetical protein